MKQILLLLCPAVWIIFSGLGCASPGSDKEELERNLQRKGITTNNSPLVAELKTIVLSDLLRQQTKRHQGSGASRLPACFICGLSSEDPGALTLSTNLNPRVEFGTANLGVGRSGLYDMETHRPAVLLWAKVISVSNQEAVILGGWHRGPTAGAAYKYYFSKASGRWVTVSVELSSMS